MKLCVQTHTRHKLYAKPGYKGWWKTWKLLLPYLESFWCSWKSHSALQCKFQHQHAQGCCEPRSMQEGKSWSGFLSQEGWPKCCGAGVEPISGSLMGPDTQKEERDRDPACGFFLFPVFLSKLRWAGMMWIDPLRSHSQFKLKDDHRCPALAQLWAEDAKWNRDGFSFNHPLNMCPHCIWARIWEGWF